MFVNLVLMYLKKMNKKQMELVINCIMWAHEHIDYMKYHYTV